MNKRYKAQPTGYCRYCYRKLDDFESNHVYCYYGDCKERFYYKNSILPKRKNKEKVPSKKQMIDNIANLLGITIEDSINKTYKQIVSKLQDGVIIDE